ncbi:hypothetical protein O6H91_02G067900 [Diphasiastrum complanatum]|uniref:Uncharacterized protein n=1 Tax=Diphasiastrum complanatum TaxID=34168 RepID=A0ACC2EGL0_DIPCM|nr:hypothetical protein O6H91_Y483400 [Diphasiastrum complanatum]KAJ7565624.1 hypothetical protein O6H91_02G067900 [Diphasiastrum complanatum]
MRSGAMAADHIASRKACILVLVLLYGSFYALLLGRSFAQPLDRWAGDHRSEQEAESGDRRSVGSQTSDEVGMRLRLIHRYSDESPDYNPNVTSAQILQKLLEMDSLRSIEFQRAFQMKSQQQERQSIASADPQLSSSAKLKEMFSDQIDIPKSNIFSGASLGLGQYLVEFSLGSPAQIFLLVIDTGSDLIWVQCYPCRSCSSLSGPIFVPSNSSTFSQLPCSSSECSLVPAPAHDICNARYPSCKYLYQYGDESQSSGIFCRDTATLKSTSGKCVQFENIAFGCGNRNAGSFNGSGGVLGLGQGDISFISQISHRYNKFSYCLGNYMRPNSSSSLLLFGNGTQNESQNSVLQYIPLVKNSLASTFYYVRVVQVSVGGEVLSIPSSVWEIDLLGNGGTVFDSGSTLSVFRMPAYAIILGAFERAIHYPRTQSVQGLDLCFNSSGSSQPALPAFYISFEGYANFQPPPSNYFVEVAEDVKCLAIQGVISPFAFNIIGNLLQQNFHIEFDRGNAQLGFAQSDCAVM